MSRGNTSGTSPHAGMSRGNTSGTSPHAGVARGEGNSLLLAGRCSQHPAIEHTIWSDGEHRIEEVGLPPIRDLTPVDL